MKYSRHILATSLSFLTAALVVEAACLQDGTTTCCAVVYMGPDFTLYPCGSGNCADLPLADSTIAFVQTVPSGFKDTPVQGAAQPCKWEDRLCVDGVCKQGGTFALTCTPSSLPNPPAQPCTP